MSSDHSMLQGINTQRRVIVALMIRELYSRFGREGLGFAWIFLEPLMFAIPVLLLWSIVRQKYEHGLLLMPLTVSGYMAILLFRHMGGSMMYCVRANVTLLYHRQIGILDIFLARALLEAITNLAALITTFSIFIALGDMDFPADLPMFYLGYVLMIWWCFAVSLLVGALAERTKLVEKIWPVYSYTYMFFSGFFYLADWLPPGLRQIALLQPSLQGYEIIRAGMFGGIVKTYGDPLYDSVFLAIMTAVGLWLLRDGRKYIVIQ